MPTDGPPEAGLLREWYARPRVEGLKAGEVITIKVHSGNQSSRSDSIRELDVVYDTQPPTVHVSRPGDLIVYPEFSNFGGSIEDNHGPDDVKISIFNLDTEKYLSLIHI